MSRRDRPNFTASFKAEVVLEALREQTTQDDRTHKMNQWNERQDKLFILRTLIFCTHINAR